MIGLFLAITLVCIYPIENLRWEIQLQDTLKGHEVEEDYQTIENAFGGLGSLLVIDGRLLLCLQGSNLVILFLQSFLQRIELVFGDSGIALLTDCDILNGQDSTNQIQYNLFHCFVGI